MAAALSVSKFTDGLTRAYPPVGAAVSLTVGMGLGNVLKGLTNKFGVDPLISGGLVAFGIARFGGGILGHDTANLWAAGILAQTINDRMNVSGMVSNAFAGLAGGRIVTASPPRFVTGTQTTTARVGDTVSHANPGV